MDYDYIRVETHPYTAAAKNPEEFTSVNLVKLAAGATQYASYEETDLVGNYDTPAEATAAAKKKGTELGIPIKVREARGK